MRQNDYYANENFDDYMPEDDQFEDNGLPSMSNTIDTIIDDITNVD